MAILIIVIARTASSGKLNDPIKLKSQVIIYPTRLDAPYKKL
jgi:hypothetical protein